MSHAFPFLLSLAVLSILGCHSAYRSTARELGYPEATRTIDGQHVKLTLPSSDKPSEFCFTIGKRPAEIDGVQYYLNKPAGRKNLSKDDILLLRQALLFPAIPKTSALNLLIDPGHGGKDSGCRNETFNEQSITLAVAKEVQQLLRELGHNVNLTRPDESTTLTLDDRTLLGASLAIDAFISIHVNASTNPEAKGVETYTLPAFGCEGSLPNSPPRGPLVGHAHLPMSTRLAYYVQHALLKKTNADGENTITDRGVRHAHFKVLRDTPAPAILIEIGFLTNAEDSVRITNPEEQKRIARQIVQGITKAFSQTN